jgi:hypothetical protein
MASTDFAEADIQRAVHCLLVQLAAADAYTGGGSPPTLCQLQETAETKMMTAYADTCRAAEVAYNSVVAHTQQQIRAAVGKALRRTNDKKSGQFKRKRTDEDFDAHGIFQPLVEQKTRPVVEDGSRVRLGSVTICLGSRADVVPAYWDSLHAADGVYALLSKPKGSKPDVSATADDTVLHAHTILVADPSGALQKAYTTMRKALETMRRALLPKTNVHRISEDK